MARASVALSKLQKTNFKHVRLLLIIAVLISKDPADTKTLEGNSAENHVDSDGKTASWYQCPNGWTLFKNHCYKVTETSLTWPQAQASCRSYGGNLVKISSQYEHEWMSQFVREQLKNVVLLGTEHQRTLNVTSSIEAWIGFVRLPNKTFQWSDGQAGSEQDGYWAVGSFKHLLDKSSAKLCSELKSQSSRKGEMRWQLVSCDEIHYSVCQLRSCERHTKHCADGSKCVNKAWMCDGFWDCNDGSDELNCLQSSVSTRCSSVFKGQNGSILSPRFPEEYPSFLTCMWKIEAASPQVIELMVSLDTEERYDALNIYEGSEACEEQLIISMSGTMNNQLIKSQGSILTIHFISDYSVQKKGFNITWTAGLETKHCGGELVAMDTDSLLSFPPSEYNITAWSILQLVTCDWIISSLNSTSLLSLQFKNITLVNDDSITVYDGRSKEMSILTHITSSIGALTPGSQQDFRDAAYTHSLNIPPVITSSGQHLLLRVIISRGSLSSFVISYKNGCGISISSSSSLIISPGFPKSQYPNNLICTWTVPKDRLGRHMKLLFLPHFVTESGMDFVQVYKSEYKELDANVTKVSGSSLKPHPDISSFHGFVINFITDATVNRGRWAVVISYDCDSLSVLPPLLHNLTDIQFGTIIGFSCRKGFTLVGPTHTVCGWNGQWQPSNLPTCTRINCGPIPDCPGGYLTNTTGQTYGSYAQYNCLFGYTLVGFNKATCGENGWENIPTCKLITCPKEYPPIGGNARAEDIKAGYLREYFCKSNLKLIGSKFSHCNISGQWSHNVPVCEAKKCINLYGQQNTQRSTTEPVPVGKSLHFSCDDGYKLNGHDELICMDNLQFNYPLPFCIDVNECENSEICGQHQCQNFNGGYSCFCQKGYKHYGNTSHVCDDINECETNNGGCSHACVNMPGEYKCDCPQNMSLYAGPLDHIHTSSLITNKTCIASCQPIVLAKGMKIMYEQKSLFNGKFLEGTKAHIICQPGLYPSGAPVVSCAHGNYWSPLVMNCTELFCDIPSKLNGGQVSYTNLTIGGSVRYFCNKNLVLKGPKIRFCEKVLNKDSPFVQLSWTSSEPECINVTCPELQNPVHGRVDYRFTTLNSLAVFRCQCGYWLVGVAVVKCKSNRQWTAPSPTCEVQYCLHPGLPPQAIMQEYTPGFPVESTVQYKCLRKGYQPSDQDSIKCLAQKQTKTSTIKPSKELLTVVQFTSTEQNNFTEVCNSSYKIDEFVNKWQQWMEQMCDILNVDVEVQRLSASTFDLNTVNFSIHLILSSGNVSTTCSCSQRVQQYFKSTLSSVTLDTWNSSCPEVNLKFNSILTEDHHWICGPGLRLHNEDHQCGQEILPCCMEDCIDEGIETISLENLTSETTESEEDESYTSKSSLWLYSSDVIKYDPGINVEISKGIEQTTQQAMSLTTASNTYYSIDNLDKTTEKQTFTPAMAELLSTTGTSSTSSNYIELLNSFKQTTTTMCTTTYTSNNQQSVSSLQPANSTIKTHLSSLSKQTANNKLITNSSHSTTDDKSSSLTSTVYRILTPTKQSVLQTPPKQSEIQTPTKQSVLETITTQKSLLSVSHSESTEKYLFPINTSTQPLVYTQSLIPLTNTIKNYFLNNLTSSRPDYQALTSKTLAIPQQGEIITDNTRTSVPLYRNTSTMNVDKKTLANSQQSTSVNHTTYAESLTSKHKKLIVASQGSTPNWKRDGMNFLEDNKTIENISTQAVEKQTATLLQGTSAPSYDLLDPMYLVEIYDYILGGFSNISCIDTVHISINNKVNKLIKEFEQDIGTLVCRDSPDVSIELNSGNIRFKSTKAKISIKFYITSNTSSRASVASCGSEFQSFAVLHWPRKLKNVEGELLVSQCKFLNYTGQGFNITYHGWICQNGYMFDESSFQCFHSSLLESLPKDPSPTNLTANPSIPVMTVPHLSMKFVGTFTSTILNVRFNEDCIKEYKLSLIKIFASLEDHLQCKLFMNIFTSVDKDINVTISNRKVIAEVVVNLFALTGNVDFLSMNNCANFTSLQFREPSHQILSVTASLASCPVLVLSAHGFRTDTNKIEILCAPGFIMNKGSFKCINEMFPQLLTRIDMVATRTSNQPSCEDLVQVSAQHLTDDVYTRLQQDISKGRICNTSENVLLLQEKTELPNGKESANISIMVVLVNLRGNKSETLDCAQHLYKYFSSNIAQLVTAVIDSLPISCQASMIVLQNYTEAYTQWMCPQYRSYDSIIHQCHIATTKSPHTQMSGQNLLDRQRRSVVHPHARPQWNGTLPTCIDIELPTFHSCPDRAHIITIGHLGPVPVLIPIPNVTDNSGANPILTYTPDISLPYRFTQNTTIEMTAVDAAGNIARCSIDVIVTDYISPQISCPTNLVTVYMDSCQKYPKISYSNIEIIASDNNGSSTIVFDPPNSSIINTSESILVTVTAIDGSFNKNNCSFLYKVENCPEWSLSTPEEGNKSCVYTEVNQELSCTISCPANKGFAVQPPDCYIFNGQWFPHKRVPRCVESKYPDYEVRLKFHLPYQGNTTGNCLNEMLNALIESVKPRVVTACWNATQGRNSTQIDSVGTFHKDSLPMITTKLKISIQLSLQNLEGTKAAQECGEALLQQLEFNGTLPGSCGIIKLGAPIASAGKYSCPVGFTYLSGMCYECPAGSYMSMSTCQECPKHNGHNTLELVNSCQGIGLDCPTGQYSTEPKCLECPVGTYQNSSKSSDCYHCRSGFSTSDVGSINESDCLAECEVNQFSLTGVKPCLPCPLGTHQPRFGFKFCDVCQFDKDGRSQYEYCKKLCAPGEYSLDGTNPCLCCPQNFYSQYNGSTFCTECPDSKVTRQEGSTSQHQCEAYDPCMSHPCKHGAQCKVIGRNFKCECSPGFIGPTCQEKEERCEHQICSNNAKCNKNGKIVKCPCLNGDTNCQNKITVTDHCMSNPCIHGSCMNTSMSLNCSCYTGYYGERCNLKKDNCGNITCYNNGVCVDLVSGFQCLCNEEFTGVFCDEKINHCQANYCLNGGSCVDGTKEFTCLCPDGFSGNFCEVDNDECATLPCLNGGLCQNGIGSFKCLCLPGYSGDKCESVMTSCELLPCLNGGTCLQTTDLYSNFTCFCREGCTGQSCELIIDVCDPMPCNTNGSYSCEASSSAFICNCLPGWEGKLCDLKVNPCSSKPCANGGTCDIRQDNFVCQCPPAFTGPTCLLPINSCKSQPCQNMGLCIEKSDGYICQCIPGFTGSLCEGNVNDCASSPCFNFGTCQDGVNAFTCSCPKGFAGDLCEISINECIREPCRHNSSCRLHNGDVLCICNEGFTGKFCEEDINDCNPNPCQHQGICVDQVASFHCICPPEYNGFICEEINDKCESHKSCHNNGTCHNIDGKSACDCTPLFTGDDCQKEKTANFDLNFLGVPISNHWPPFIHTGNLSGLSLCLWVKFRKAEAKGTYLVLTFDERLTHALTLRDSQVISTLFASKEIILYINDGHWHHFCLVISLPFWTIFKDGLPFQNGINEKWKLGNSLGLNLGQPLDNKANDEWFKGHLHDVNIFNFVLNKEDIFKMSQNCDFKMPGNVFNWVTADSYMSRDIEINMPSQCGQAMCSNGSHLCSLIEGDKILPECVTCPGTIIVTSEIKLVSVTWSEPEFTDNVGIVSVMQNFRSGQIFPHGHYLVNYVAYDAENNSASCSFQIFVRKLKCVDPVPPANGARMCGAWKHGRFCIPSCTENFHFVTPIPPLYRCGYEGVWDPVSGDQFVFPKCARSSQPSLKMFGTIDFKGPVCSETNKMKLKDKISNIMAKLDNGMQLCGSNEVCNHTHKLDVKCNGDNERKKRDAIKEGSMFTVGLNISLPNTLSNNSAEPSSVPDNVVQLIKQDQSQDFLVASVDLHHSLFCEKGQILTNSDKPLCLSCPAGYYQTTETVCSLCPKGWFSEKSQQITCIQCPDGLTTSIEGATSRSQCATVCEPGTYFSKSILRCEPCPVGEYQELIGQWNCVSCPLGLTTQSVGATLVTDCQDLCGSGQEIGFDGICVDCPIGTFSDGKEGSLFCSPCPYGWTTEKQKAVDQTQCTIKKCDKGYYHHLEDRVCYPCPQGTYQEKQGATSCLPCGVRQTTNHEGAVSRSLCIAGQVNECQLKIDLCASGTKCVDIDDGYNCEYVCEDYCNTLKFCNDGDSVKSKECHCAVDMCKNNNTRDSVYRSLVTTSIIVTVSAVLVLLAIITICLYRRNHQKEEDQHVRIYRDETELASFTNKAFDSLSAHQDNGIEKNNCSLQMPRKIATRWHNNNFASKTPFADEIESANL